MTEFEWVTRCQMEFARNTNDFSHDWSSHAEACYQTTLEMPEWFADDPESAANDEMSYWD